MLIIIVYFILLINTYKHNMSNRTSIILKNNIYTLDDEGIF